MRTSIREFVISYRRTAFAGALVALALLGDSFLYAALPVHYREVGINLIAVGWMLSLNRWVRLLTNAVAGWLGTRLGWSIVFTAALWLTVAATLGYGCAKSVAMLLLLRGLWGLCWSILRLGGQAAVLAESHPKERSSHMGLFTGIFRLGSLCGMAVGGYLADRTSFRVAALWLAVITAIGAIVSSLPQALSGKWGPPAKEKAHCNSPRMATAWLPKGREEWAVCISAATLYFVTSGIVTSTVGLLVVMRLGKHVTIGNWILGASTLSGFLLSTRWVIDFLLGPLFGWYADRFGRPLMLSVGYSMIIMMLVALSKAHGLLVVSLSLIALFSSGTACAVTLDGWAGNIAGHTPGRFLPIYATWIDAGSAIAPLVGYYILGICSLEYEYLTSAAIVFVGGILSWQLSRADRK